jgi:hypothetical protein
MLLVHDWLYSLLLSAWLANFGDESKKDMNIAIN